MVNFLGLQDLTIDHPPVSKAENPKRPTVGSSWPRLVTEHDYKKAYAGAHQPKDEKGEVGYGEEGEDGREDEEGAQSILSILCPTVRGSSLEEGRSCGEEL